MAEISSGAKRLVLPWYCTSMEGVSPSGPGTTLKGKRLMSSTTSGSLMLRPMRRFASKIVLVGLPAAWLCAAWPMRRSSSLKETTDGVVREPSELAMISTWSCSQTPTQL